MTKHTSTPQKTFLLTGIALAIATLAGCGSGGGSGGGTTPVSQIAGAVIDGRIAGATVCLDLNANLACDTNEPSAATDASGNYTLNTAGLTVNDVMAAHLFVTVPSTAKDLDDGGLTISAAGKQAFTMLAPGSANGTVLVTPLTTLVSNELMRDPSKTTNEAHTAVRSLLGVPESTDLNQDPSAGTTEIKNIARSVATMLGEIRNKLQTSATNANVTLTSAQLQDQTLSHVKQHVGTILSDANLNSSTPVNLTQVRLLTNNLTAGLTNITVAQAGISTVGQSVNVTAALTNTLYAAGSNLVVCAQPSSSPLASPLRPLAAPSSSVFPMNLTVQSGGAAVSISGNDLLINQTSADVVIRADTFSIGSGNRVIISQPSKTATMTINVTQASYIDGQLIAGQGSLTLNAQSNTTSPALTFGASSELDSRQSSGFFMMGTNTNNGYGVVYLGSNATLNNSISNNNTTGVVFLPLNISINTSSLNVSGSANTSSGINLSSNWQRFNISTSGGVIFNQSSGSGVSVNNVTGSGRSNITGSLQSNSQVFLVSPSVANASMNSSSLVTIGSASSATGVTITTSNAVMPNTSVSNIAVSNASSSALCTAYNIKTKALTGSTAYTETRYGMGNSTWVNMGSPYVATSGNSTFEVVNYLSQNNGWVVPSLNGTYAGATNGLSGILTDSTSGLKSKLTVKAVDVSGWSIKNIKGLEFLPAINGTLPAGAQLFWLSEEQTEDLYVLYPFFEYTGATGNYNSLASFIADHPTSGGASKAVQLISLSPYLQVTFDNANEVTFWQNSNTSSTSTVLGTSRYEMRTVNGQTILVILQIPAAAYNNINNTVNATQRRLRPIFALKNNTVYGGNLKLKGTIEDFSTPHFNKAAISKIGQLLNWPTLP